MTKNLEVVKKELLAQIEKRVNDKIIEPTNAAILNKLISRAEDVNEAIAIATLGTTYKRTGFHFDARLEKTDDNTIKYFKKNDKLSFQTSPDSITHKLIIGDNYQALQNLLIEYKNKVDVIYIDPPYGKDSMGEFAETNYDNSLTRDNLLSMLYPRLILAKQLLSDDGVIFCSIDDKNQAYVKCLFDEIFDERNFVANLIWQKKKGGSQDSDSFSREHEYILCYQRKEWHIIDVVEDFDEDSFSKIINDKKAKIMKLEKWGNHSLRTDRPTLYYPIKSPDGSDFYPIAPNGEEGCWRKKPENLDKEHIYWQKNSKGRLTPYEVIYYDEVKDKVKIVKTRTIFTDYGTTTDGTKDLLKIFNNKKVFDNPKPVSLIKKLVSLSVSSNKDNAVILDFFAGSGTTGQAVLELNKEDGGSRQFILVQLNEITEITPNGIVSDVLSKRLKRVMTGECYDGTKNFEWITKNQPLGDNLDVYDIASVSNASNIKDKTPFDVIDETLYGKEKFKTVKEKIEWVIDNFEHTQKYLDGEE